MATVEAPLAPAERETGHDFGELNVERLRPFVVSRNGQEFLLYAGLVTALHAVSDGYFAIDTRLEQLPSAENGHTAVASARVQIFDYDAPDVVRRAASGIGDANAGNVGKQMTGATIRMAETRAKARALRDLLGLRMAALEELGGDDDAAPASAPAPKAPSAPTWGGYGASGAAPRPVETIQVEGRTFGRGQVLDIYHARLSEAERAGLQLAPMGSQGGPPNSDAPLEAIVRFSSELKRRLEARSSAK